jgi:hypothetical protein
LQDCPECRRRDMIASQMRALADAMLIPVARVTNLPPEVVQGFVEGTTTGAVAAGKAKSRKRSAYSRAYKNAFKRVSSKYKKKNGQWKANGFKAAVREAHRVAKRGKK